MRQARQSDACSLDASFKPWQVLRVVLGEDSYLAREGISRALEAADEVELVASGGNVE